MKMRVIDDPRRRLEQSPDPDQCWLLCDECRRFFQYASARPLGRLAHDRCPFPDCRGYGVGFTLFLWDDMREPDDPRWPSSPDQLEHGMRAPDMEPFYEAQLAGRIEAMVSAFLASPEQAESLGGTVPRYLGPFLQMMADLCCDLTEEPPRFGLAAEIIDDLPVWSRTADLNEAPRMVAELRAFFAFAGRTGILDDAQEWIASLDDARVERLRYTMRHDRRLQPCKSRSGKRRRPARSRKRRRRRARN